MPHEPFDDRDRPNVLRFTLSPDAIALELNLNGEGDPFDLERVSLDNAFPTQELPPYSLLLKEILEGDPTLSIRGDEAEELWRIVEPVLSAWERDEVPLEEYAAGSGGPKGAKAAPQGTQDGEPQDGAPRDGAPPRATTRARADHRRRHRSLSRPRRPSAAAAPAQAPRSASRGRAGTAPCSWWGAPRGLPGCPARRACHRRSRLPGPCR